jgi:predicted transcriptional regulator of viral defense system
MPDITLHINGIREAKMTARRPDRRNLTRRQAVSAQLRAVLSSPSLLLTIDEMQRLLQLQRDACQRILRRLLEAGVLREIQRGVYTPTTLISGLPTP